LKKVELCAGGLIGLEISQMLKKTYFLVGKHLLKEADFFSAYIKIDQ
jgi:hypothetical protein